MMERDHERMIAARLEANRIPFHSELPGKLAVYLRLLRAWNEKMDLTAVEGEADLLDRHFTDSLTVLRTGLVTGAPTLIDVGTGAGFPGMVLAMALPEARVTLLDSQQKRLSFLETVRTETGTRNVTLVHVRAEDGARQPELREQFDLACARAVAPLNVLCELLLPYVRVGGRMLCWKGPGLAEEMESGRRAAFLLGGRTEEPLACPVEGRDWDHRILPVLKTGATPRKYPRKAGVPKRDPLAGALPQRCKE
ncbi:MAG: 16S rRNA (guanine(527)-N(7))-methyltransferase RsmG [Clostridia bacterium]|nr:16S rRNA (guanine(527)-N(7))-methyltransferase RsmG [Clostridia bacterium]